ncbi:MAG TPA: DUF6351 family protein [Roseiflexaceae bacterium]|nr:DUF6351 family protein [Roseiflexaceae bacterium]
MISKLLRAGICLAILASGLFAPVSASAAPLAAPTPGPCVDGRLPSGALSRICIPSSGWNGDLVIFAHGYIAFNQPLDFQHLVTPDGTSVPDLIQGLGFAFATTSYRRNGLAILEGADDVRELAHSFRATHGVPRHTYLTGVSEGGIITALLAEQSPELFDGGLSGCGPIGNFRQQLNYYGDMRVLFDYFFPGVLPGSVTSIPAETIANWDAVYLPRIKAAIAANPSKARQLAITARALVNPDSPTEVETAITRLLWYNVFATNDGIQQLGGNPYDNSARVYIGSSNDLLLNARVKRYRADPAALQIVQRYETTGRLSIPLVTLHTTGDELIPFWHQAAYVAKVSTTGDGSLVPIPIPRFGHCNFTSTELIGGFAALVLQVSGLELLGVQRLKADPSMVRGSPLSKQRATR